MLGRTCLKDKRREVRAPSLILLKLMNRFFYSLSLLLWAIFFTIPSAAHATKYSGGTIEIYLSQQQRINWSEMLAEAMDKYGAGLEPRCQIALIVMYMHVVQVRQN